MTRTADILAARDVPAKTLFPALDLLGKQLHGFPRSHRLLISATSALAGEKIAATTPFDFMNFTMTLTMAPRSAWMRLTGDLDYESIDELVDTTSRPLAQHVDLAHLHLDFSELTFLDSAALSGLLLIHRRTSCSGVELHLDHRPPFLDRVLQVTGLFGHFITSDSYAPASDPVLLGQGRSD